MTSSCFQLYYKLHCSSLTNQLVLSPEERSQRSGIYSRVHLSAPTWSVCWNSIVHCLYFYSNSKHFSLTGCYPFLLESTQHRLDTSKSPAFPFFLMEWIYTMNTQIHHKITPAARTQSMQINRVDQHWNFDYCDVNLTIVISKVLSSSHATTWRIH